MGKKLSMKLKLTYARNLSIRLLTSIICYIVYPIAYAFRTSIWKYMDQRTWENSETHLHKMKDGYKKSDLYKNIKFWGWTMLCGGADNIVGGQWYMKEKKTKWFTVFSDDKHNTPIPQNFKEKVRFFYLSYLWAGTRNAAWNFAEWFLRDGSNSIKSERVIVYRKLIENLSEGYNPHAKYKDADGSYRDNDGPYIKYTFDYNPENPNDALWKSTIEGKVAYTYTGATGKERYEYLSTKIRRYKLIKRFYIQESQFGWNDYDGLLQFHWKHMFKKMDELSISDYDKYQELIKTQK